MTLTIKCQMNLWEWAKTYSWSGGRQGAQYYTMLELDELQNILNDIKEEWDEVEINDLFWFEDEYICELLGIDYEEFQKRDKQWNI